MNEAFHCIPAAPNGHCKLCREGRVRWKGSFGPIYHELAGGQIVHCSNPAHSSCSLWYKLALAAAVLYIVFHVTR